MNYCLNSYCSNHQEMGRNVPFPYDDAGNQEDKAPTPNEKVFSIHATNHVVNAAGAFNSPKL